MSDINFDAHVDKYVRLRDKITEINKKHKEELAPFKEALDTLGDMLLGHLNSTHQESSATKHGTVYKTKKDSVSIADMTAFWEFVTSQGQMDMVDRKANVTAVREYMEEKKLPVPGVNFSSVAIVGVRRANGS
jgi:hypothetical protein